MHLQRDNKLSFWHTYHLQLVKELFQQEQVMLALVVVSLGLASEFVGVVVVSLGLAPEFVGVVVVSLGLVLEFLALVVVVSLVLALVEHCLKVFLSYVLHCVSTVKALNFAWDLFWRIWHMNCFRKINYHANILAAHCINNVTNTKSTKLNSNEITFMGNIAKYNTHEI